MKLPVVVDFETEPIEPRPKYPPKPVGVVLRTIHSPPSFSAPVIFTTIALSLGAPFFVHQRPPAIVPQTHRASVGHLKLGGRSHEVEVQPRLRSIVAPATSTAMASSPFTII